MPLTGREALSCRKTRWYGRFCLLKFEQIEPLGAWFAERLAELRSAEGDTLAGRGAAGTTASRARTGAGYNQAALTLQAPGEKAPIAA